MLTGLAYPMTHVDGDTLLVELLYEQEEARLDEGQLLAGVNKVLSRTVRAGDDGQPMLLASYGHPSDPARIDLSQTWGFPQARRVLDRCQAVMTIGERSVGPFPPAQRLDAFRAAVLAVCRLTAPAAAWWPTATQLLPPPSPARGGAAVPLTAGPGVAGSPGPQHDLARHAPARGLTFQRRRQPPAAPSPAGELIATGLSAYGGAAGCPRRGVRPLLPAAEAGSPRLAVSAGLHFARR
jgi:hypothetical protein